MKAEEVNNTVNDIVSSMKKLDEDLKDTVKNKLVRIKSKYNGQPFGSSAKPLTGTVHQIRDAFYDRYFGANFFIEGKRLALSLAEVEFVDEES